MKANREGLKQKGKPTHPKALIENGTILGIKLKQGKVSNYPSKRKSAWEQHGMETRPAQENIILGPQRGNCMCWEKSGLQ